MITIGKLLLEKMKQTVLNKKSFHQSSPRKVCSYISLLDLYKNYSSLVHNDFSL